MRRTKFEQESTEETEDVRGIAGHLVMSRPSGVPDALNLGLSRNLVYVGDAMLTDDRTRHERFLRVFMRNEHAVRAYVRRLVPLRADADDIVQEVAIVLWEKFDEFDEETGNFKAWACEVARYKVLSWLRDKGRRRLVLEPDVVATIADESQHAEPELERQRNALESCLEKVPEKQRSLLAAAYEQDGRIQDLAAASGRTVVGFYQWLYRMRLKLLECMQRELAEESLL